MAVTLTGSAATALNRCMTCNAEIDPIRLESHVCQGVPPSHAPNPVGPVMDRFNGASSSMSVHRNGPFQGKLPKFAPPRIDPFAANEAFLLPRTSHGVQSDLTSSSSARSDSPASFKYRMPPRSATTPHFRDRPPSSEMLMSQDSAFPIFPTKKVREEKAKKESQRSKSVSRSQSRDRSLFRVGNSPSSSSAPRSASPAVSQFPPRPSTAAGSMSRKSSISSTKSRGEPAPFSHPSEPIPPLPSHHDNNSVLLPRSESQAGSFSEQLTQTSSPLTGLPLITGQEVNDNLLQSPQTERSSHLKQPSMSAAIKPLDAIGSTRRPNNDLGLNTLRRQSASGSKPSLQTNDDSPTLEIRSAVVDRRPPEWRNDTVVPAALAIRQPHEAKINISDVNERSEDILGSLPSFKPQDNGALTSTSTRLRSSASSDGSSYSATNSVSSQSSPPTSASSFTMQENIQKGDHIDNILGEIADRSKSPTAQEPTIPSLAPVQTSTTAFQQRQRGPTKSFSRPNYAKPQMDLAGGGNAQISQVSQKPGPGDQTSMFSSAPHDQQSSVPSLESRIPGEVRSPLSDLRLATTAAPISPLDRSFSPMSPKVPQTPSMARSGESGSSTPRRPTTPGFKGNCRGCGDMIVGKSVSSADGRLAGRYHKQCFVCQTCKEPFQTVDFYVINNQPYCQRHYHTLNGSLCTNCDRGIEGPYMETDAKKKFHPHCFTCKECHLILRNDYFEINGIIYCEKHSRKPDLLGPGRRFPERRTTRLMMM